MKEHNIICLFIAVCLAQLSWAHEAPPPADIQTSLSYILTGARTCDNRACDQNCRRIGHTGGICVNGRCKCDINIALEEQNLKPKYEITPESLAVDRASCDNRECDQRCRRIGLTGGVCVNGRCKCDINLVREEQKVNYASCDNRACDRICRRMGFTGGACVNGRCKCDINLSQEKNSENEVGTQDQIDRASCDNRACDQICRRMGFTGGVCANGRCKCDINLAEEENSENEVGPKYQIGRASCDNRECDQSCRRMGFTGGVCVNGRCKCDINIAREENSEDELELQVLQGDRASCNNRECNQRCRRMGFTGGVCVNGRCKCDINIAREENSEDELELQLLQGDRASCYNRECNQRCRRMGFTGGVCVNGRCKCDINIAREENSEDELELQLLQGDRASCNNRECNQRCRRMGFTGGVCVNGRCKCDINMVKEKQALNPENEVGPKYQIDRNSCNNRACNQLCRRLGFTGGVCVNGRCKCDNFSMKSENDGK